MKLVIVMNLITNIQFLKVMNFIEKLSVIKIKSFIKVIDFLKAIYSIQMRSYIDCFSLSKVVHSDELQSKDKLGQGDVLWLTWITQIDQFNQSVKLHHHHKVQEVDKRHQDYRNH